MQSFCVVSLNLCGKVVPDRSLKLRELHYSKQVISWVCRAQRNTETGYKWHFLFDSRTILLTMEYTYTEHLLLSTEQVNMEITVTLFARQTAETSCTVVNFFPHGSTTLVGLGLFIVDFSRTHSVRHITLGRTPLDEWSARRRDLYLTTQRHSQETRIRAP